MPDGFNPLVKAMVLPAPKENHVLCDVSAVALLNAEVPVSGRVLVVP